MKLRVAAIALTALLIFGYIAGRAAHAQNQQQVPDAPMPQSGQTLPGATGPIAPGKAPLPPGAGSSTSSNPAVPDEPPAPPKPAPTQPATSPQPPVNQEGPDNAGAAAPEEGAAALARFVVNVNFVEVPVIVKDAKGNPVAGLTYRDFQVFENNTRVPLSLFSVDPAPLSIAFVIDQSLGSNIMANVNHSLGAIQGALTPYDEAAVFTYGNGAKEWTGFTGAQSNRLPAVLSLAQAVGSDPQVPINDGPLAGCSIRENGSCVDPNLQPGKSAGNDTFMTIPKEIHTLNDAILQAAKELSSRPKGRLRIIYVVSDGKEYGSKATEKEVVRYLQTNKIAVYATLVGDSARWGEGWIDRMHLPLTMYDNILYKYTVATGGDVESEGNTNGMEKSYAKIADEARNQYTLGYLSHESIYDAKFRNIEVRVDRPNLEVNSKAGYYPSAQDYK